MIKLKELRIENDKYVEKLCLINPAKIVSVQSGLLAKKGPHLIGLEREREARMIVLEGGSAIFVEASIEEIDLAIGR